MATRTSRRDTIHRVFLRERGEGEMKIWSGVVTNGVQIVYVLWLRTSYNRYGTIFFCITLYQQPVRSCRIVDVHDPDRKNATLFLSLPTLQNSSIVILTLWIIDSRDRANRISEQVWKCRGETFFPLQRAVLRSCTQQPKPRLLVNTESFILFLL